LLTSADRCYSTLRCHRGCASTMGLFRQPRKEHLNAYELQLDLKLTSLLVCTSKQLTQIVDKLKEEEEDDDRL
jgi:hypothetical protein